MRALRAGFWEQLKATIKRNVVRKMRNKRHTLKVGMVIITMIMITMIMIIVARNKRHTIKVGRHRKQVKNYPSQLVFEIPEAQNIEGGLLKIQFQEVVGPIYFMAIIIILKLTLKSPYMEAVLDPPGSSNVNYTAPLRG